MPKPVFSPFISCIQALLLPHWSALSWGVRIFVADLLGPLFNFPFPLSFSGVGKSQVTFHGGLPCRAQTLTIDKMRKEIRRTDLPNLSERARAFKDESCTPIVDRVLMPFSEDWQEAQNNGQTKRVEIRFYRLFRGSKTHGSIKQSHLEGSF